MIRQMLVALLVVSLLPIAALAQGPARITDRDWEISFFAGGSYLTDRAYTTPVTGLSTPTSRDIGLSYSSSAQMGFRIAENRWQHFGAVMEYGFSNQPLTFTNLTPALPILKLGHGIHRFSYSGVFYPLARNHRLRPYAFAGPGVALFHVTRSGKDLAEANGLYMTDPWKFTMNWGGGVKYLVSDTMGVAFQFGDNISRVPHYGIPPNVRATSGVFLPGFQPSGSLHNRLLSLSFIYQWGSR